MLLVLDRIRDRQSRAINAKLKIELGCLVEIVTGIVNAARPSATFTEKYRRVVLTCGKT